MKWHAYRNMEPKAQPPRPFNQQEALENIRRVQEELNQSGPWPENLLPWLKADHKGVSLAIRAAADAVDHACLNQDATRLDKALVEYKRACLEGLTLWRQREQQTTLTTA